jgi:hypothetical protein
MTFSLADFHKITGMRTDGHAGFCAQVASRDLRNEVETPDHLLMAQAREFKAGAELARAWMAMRAGAGQARRAMHAEQLRAGVATTPSGSLTPSDLRAEQVAALESVVKTHRQLEARAAEMAMEPQAIS